MTALGNRPVSRLRAPKPLSRTRWGSLLALLVLALLAVPAHAQAPIHHEYFEPSPQEDLLLQATTAAGTMPAAMDTPSGVVRAPDVLRQPEQNERAYNSDSTPSSSDASYRIDRDTKRPDVVPYDDPFIPAIAPFKRLYAYDSVDDSLELVVKHKELERLVVGGEAGSDDDRFYADMVVDLADHLPVRIPTVGPGARVLVANTNPPLKIELLHDGADNWFIRGPERRRVRLIMMLAIPRAVFGQSLANVGYDELLKRVPALPQAIRPAAHEVLGEIGVSTALRPKEAVARLVAYFRGFAPSDDLPKAESGAALYKELALSKKGVCRHRAYAFVISALELGIPARMVRNEAHAWVEVYDGKLWHLIDLGGSANRLDFREESTTQQYRAPADPFQWPPGSDSAQELAARSISGAPATGADDASRARSGPGSTPSPASSAAQPLGLENGDAGAAQGDSRPTARLSVAVGLAELLRGNALPISGRVDADGEACQYARVDIALRNKNGRLMSIGALPADRDGHFDGAVTVPLDVEIGQYDVVVSTPGDARCGPGQGE